MNDLDALQVMKEWVQQYKDDEEPQRIAQSAAIAAMDVMLVAFRHGLDATAIKAGLCEVQRMLEILNAFHGRLAMLEIQREGFLHKPEV